MKLKLTLVFLTGLFCVSLSTAQSQKKLKRLLDKGKDEKILKITQKAIDKDKATSDTWYYRTKVELKSVIHSKEENSQEYFDRALKSWSHFDNDYKDKRQSALKKEMALSAKKLLKSVSDTDTLNQKYYVSVLAEQFGDTISSFYVLFPGSVAHKKGLPNENEIKKVLRNRNGLTYMVPEPLPDGAEIISYSETGLKTPWVMGGIKQGEGFDCSGFVIWAYGRFGFDLPHKTKWLAKIGKPVALEEALPGDIVCFGTKEPNPQRVYHVGMIHSVLDDGVNLIHCGTSTGVTIASLTEGYWSNSNFYVVRIMDQEK